MATRVFDGQLEVDHARGVIYFHAADPDVVKEFGTVSILRICKLPTPIKDSAAIDVTHMFGVWYISSNTLEGMDDERPRPVE